MSTREVKEIPIAKTFLNPEFNCRGMIKPTDVLDLAKDIEANGLQSPIIVRPIEHDHFQYEIIAGHRRFTAHKVLKKETIEAFVRDDLTEDQAVFTNLSENLLRKELNIVEEAHALKKLKDFGWGQTEVGERIGKSQTWVRIRFLVLDLPPEIQDACAAGFIKQEHILELAKIHNTEKQFEYAKEIKEAALRGEKVKPKAPKRAKDLYKRKQRGKTEIDHMLEHIQESIGNNFGTRCLAWAGGEISDLELFRDIKEIADKVGLNYDMPLKMDLSIV